MTKKEEKIEREIEEARRQCLINAYTALCAFDHPPKEWLNKKYTIKYYESLILKLLKTGER